MVKGINKQMVVLSIEGNKLYESACFVLKNDASASRETKKDMLAEANKILCEMDIGRARRGRVRRPFFKRFFSALVLLLIGGVAGFALSFFI